MNQYDSSDIVVDEHEGKPKKSLNGSNSEEEPLKQSFSTFEIMDKPKTTKGSSIFEEIPFMDK